MKIFFTKKQYRTLLNALFAGSWIAGIMQDYTDEEKYVTQYGDYEDLTNTILQHAKDFGVDKQDIEVFAGNYNFSEEYYDNHISDITDFVDFEVFDGMVNRLAKRDFYKMYTQEQVEEMDDIERIEKIYECEEKYRSEFEKNGFENLYINNVIEKGK